jgi:hypothetical protein
MRLAEPEMGLGCGEDGQLKVTLFWSIPVRPHMLALRVSSLQTISHTTRRSRHGVGHGLSIKVRRAIKAMQA